MVWTNGKQIIGGEAIFAYEWKILTALSAKEELR